MVPRMKGVIPRLPERHFCGNCPRNSLARAGQRGIMRMVIPAQPESPMRRLPLAILVILGLVGFDAAASLGGDKSAPITIEYHGQSHYVITTSKGKRIAIDPHTIPAYFPTGR